MKRGGKRVKKILSKRNFIKFVFVTMILSSVFVTIRMIMAPTVAPFYNPDVRVKSDYFLMLLQCILGTFAMLLPGFTEKRLKVSIPTNMIFVYSAFLYCAIYLGEVKNFYYRIPNWDMILHTFSGAMIGALGFTVISFLNKTEKVPVYLTPVFVAFFSFCFAVTVGVVWEFYEYAADGLLGTNMQKFRAENGTLFVGHYALSDTMADLLVDCIGAFAMSVIGYISIKYDKNWHEKLMFNRKIK